MSGMVNQDEGLPTFTIQGPNGEPVPARPAPSVYIPPSRERVAQVIAECEKALSKSKSQNGKSQVGALLRLASKRLYWDGTNETLAKTVFPHALLVEVLTSERIEGSLCFDSASPQTYAYDINECVRRIRGTGGPDQLGRFARIFATLLLCGMEQDIFQFFQKELDDTEFPFRLGYDDDGEGGSLCPKSWSKSVAGFPRDREIHLCESFSTAQWRVFLPCFDQGHQTFEKDRIMPWYDYHTRATGSSTASSDGGMSAPGGAYSEVSRVVIHDGHHKFDGLIRVPGSPVSFAVKRLKTKKEDDFNREVAMLRNLGGKKPHTVKLLATFRHDDTYCLLFPWAECDLLAYWTREPDPQEMRATLAKWVSDQCLGLISAVGWIHNPSGDVLDPQNRELFGRHGDIKPENILWYKGTSAATNPLASGELVISDFGLSALNHKNTCTNIKNGDILHTTAYAPPESVLADHVISRSIDIWALGCVYLEFITWLIGGPKLVVEFKIARLAPFLGNPIKNEVFWELQTVENPVTGKSGLGKVVKPQVIKWIESLWNGPRATQYIRDFLDIIADDMLVTDKAKRRVASDLIPKFRSLVGKDHAYYTAPVGRGQKVIQVTQPPIIQNLSLHVQDVIARSGKPLPHFSGQQRLISPRTGSAHLRL